MKTKLPAPVLIGWDDPTTTTGWKTPDEAKSIGPGTMWSLGWLIEDGPEVVRVALDWSEDAEGEFNSIGVLPRGCIRSIEYIKIVRPRKTKREPEAAEE